MKCPSCKFEAKNGTSEWTFDKKSKVVYCDEWFFTLRGTFLLDLGHGSKDEVNPVVCPKCGTIFVEHYKINE